MIILVLIVCWAVAVFRLSTTEHDLAACMVAVVGLVVLLKGSGVI